MVKEQFERLKIMHGYLFPVLTTDGTSFVSTVDFEREALEKSIGRTVRSTTLLTFLVGNDIEEMPFLLPLVVFIAVAKVNGNFLGFNDEEVSDKIRQNYSACKWLTCERADGTVDELAPVSLDETLGWERYSAAVDQIVLSLRSWLIDEAGDVRGQAENLKAFLETFGESFDFTTIDRQFLPQCECAAS